MVYVNPNVVISMGKWWENGLNPHKTLTTQPFSFNFVAMISIPLKIFQIGAVGDLV
jgi:hypothetical protein